MDDVGRPTFLKSMRVPCELECTLAEDFGPNVKGL